MPPKIAKPHAGTAVPTPSTIASLSPIRGEDLRNVVGMDTTARVSGARATAWRAGLEQWFDVEPGRLRPLVTWTAQSETTKKEIISSLVNACGILGSNHPEEHFATSEERRATLSTEPAVKRTAFLSSLACWLEAERSVSPLTVERESSRLRSSATRAAQGLAAFATDPGEHVLVQAFAPLLRGELQESRRLFTSIPARSALTPELLRHFDKDLEEAEFAADFHDLVDQALELKRDPSASALTRSSYESAIADLERRHPRRALDLACLQVETSRGNLREDAARIHEAWRKTSSSYDAQWLISPETLALEFERDLTLASVHAKSGDLGAALALLRTYHTAEPKFRSASLLACGALCTSLGRKEEAISDLTLYLAENPDFERGCLAAALVASLHAEQGNLLEAARVIESVESVESAVAQSPRTEDARTAQRELRLVHAHLNLLSQAPLPSLPPYAPSTPAAPVWFLRICALLMKGDLSLARAQFQALMSREPSAPECLRLRTGSWSPLTEEHAGPEQNDVNRWVEARVTDNLLEHRVALVRSLMMLLAAKAASVPLRHILERCGAQAPDDVIPPLGAVATHLALRRSDLFVLSRGTAEGPLLRALRSPDTWRDPRNLGGTLASGLALSVERGSVHLPRSRFRREALGREVVSRAVHRLSSDPHLLEMQDGLRSTRRTLATGIEGGGAGPVLLHEAGLAGEESVGPPPTSAEMLAAFQNLMRADDPTRPAFSFDAETPDQLSGPEIQIPIELRAELDSAWSEIAPVFSGLDLNTDSPLEDAERQLEALGYRLDASAPHRLERGDVAVQLSEFEAAGMPSVLVELHPNAQELRSLRYQCAANLGGTILAEKDWRDFERGVSIVLGRYLRRARSDALHPRPPPSNTLELRRSLSAGRTVDLERMWQEAQSQSRLEGKTAATKIDERFELVALERQIVAVIDTMAQLGRTPKAVFGVFEGPDAASKTSNLKTILRLFLEGLGPNWKGRMVAIKAPTESEQGDQWLDPFKALRPRPNEIVFCDRYATGRFVYDLDISDKRKHKMARDLVKFETSMTDDGILVIKFLCDPEDEGKKAAKRARHKRGPEDTTERKKSDRSRPAYTFGKRFATQIVAKAMLDEIRARRATEDLSELVEELEENVRMESHLEELAEALGSEGPPGLVDAANTGITRGDIQSYPLRHLHRARFREFAELTSGGVRWNFAPTKNRHRGRVFIRESVLKAIRTYVPLSSRTERRR